MPTGMRRAWRCAAAIMLAICLFMVWQSLQLPLTDRLGPGPGFFPFWLSLAGAVLASGLLLSTVLDTSNEAPAPILPRQGGALRVVAVLAALALVAGLMTVLGFRLSMLLFVAGLVVALGERRWWAVASFALGASFGVHYVFNTGLDVILPDGVLGI